MTNNHDEQCGEQVIWTCEVEGCGATWTGHNCGHEAQPTPVSPDYLGHLVCDDHAEFFVDA